MTTIPAREWRDRPDYRSFVADALWTFRQYQREHPNLFVYSKDRPRWFLFRSPVFMNTIEWDRLTHSLSLEMVFEEDPKARRIEILAPELTKQYLVREGYQYKIDILTEQELDWLQNGVPVPGKPNARYPPPDYFYYFKQVDGVEVRIFVAAGELFFGGVKLKHPDQLPLIEKQAKENAKWAHLDAKLEDTKPLELTDTFTPVIPCKHEDVQSIELVGGPLDGQFVTWNIKLRLYLGQYATGDKGKEKAIAARYLQNKQNKNIYEFQQNVY